MTVALNTDMPTLLRLLACPSCRGALVSDGDALRCTTGGHSYALRDRVPVMLDRLDTERGSSALTRLYYGILGNPRIYDFQQKHFGGEPVAAEMAKELAAAGEVTLLDVGAGTGMVAELVSSSTRYVWLDHDTRKLQGLLTRSPECFAVLGDAARLPFADGSVDSTIMIEVSHHIPDAALRTCLREVARVTRDRFIFVDAVRGPRLRSKMMWKLDLGRFPRTEADLLPTLRSSFEVERVERFRGVNHDHVMCICRPRSVPSEPSARVV